MSIVYRYVRNQLMEPGNGLIKLILIHILSFLSICLFETFGYICGYANQVSWLYEKFTLPSLYPLLLSRPWALLTYSFMHNDSIGFCWHIYVLYTLAQRLSAVTHEKHLVRLYLLGHIVGALVFLMLHQLSPPFRAISTHLSGPLPSIYAIAAAVCVFVPYLRINCFVVSIPLRGMVLFLLLLDFMGLTRAYAGSACIARLGGACIGYWYAKIYTRGNNNRGSVGQKHRFIKIDRKLFV